MTEKKHEGERIAKRLSRAGVASRREVERMIEAGRISVNGKLLESPAFNVVPSDKILVDNKPVAAAEPVRVWRYYKPLGLVTSNSDEKGRETIFDRLPKDLPRVMTVGRLDINSEGLLLLTNDGELKRKLELPSTGWVRKYRVRANGYPTDATLEPLRKGITVEGERFQPMQVTIDRQQGANAWLTIGLREGKNREIRRAIEAIGMTVNRLIRISYGPFQLGDMKDGEVDEIRPSILRDQLGIEMTPEITRQVAPTEKPSAPRVRQVRPGSASPGISLRGKKRAGAKPSGGKPAGDRPTGGKPFGDKPSGGKPYGGKPSGDRPSGGKPYGGKSAGDRPSGGKSFGGKPSGGKPSGNKGSWK